MFKTILMTAAAAVVITAAAAPAHALVGLNGKELNGRELNGTGNNGIYPNGSSMEGMPTGVATFVIDGIELPARVR